MSLYHLSPAKVIYVDKKCFDVNVMLNDYSKTTLAIENENLLNLINRNDTLYLVYFNEKLMSVLHSGNYYPVKTNNYYDQVSLIHFLISLFPFGQLLSIYYLHSTVDDPRNPLMLENRKFIKGIARGKHIVIVSLAFLLVAIQFFYLNQIVISLIALSFSSSLSLLSLIKYKNLIEGLSKEIEKESFILAEKQLY